MKLGLSDVRKERGREIKCVREKEREPEKGRVKDVVKEKRGTDKRKR